MPTTVIKVGGSLLFPGKPDISLIKKMASQIDNLGKTAVVVGAGRILRDSYLSTLRGSGLDREFLDTVGILIAQINARIFSKFLKNGIYAETLADAKAALASGKTPVMGGLKPRQSTDAVASQLAEAIKASTLLVLTDVDGIYDKDPNENPDAKKFDKMTFSQLVDLTAKLSAQPGNYPVFDAVAAETVARAKIKTIIGNGRTQTLASLLSGKAATVVQ